jgi:hypothetical protein
MQSLVREHEEFMRAAEPKLAWYRAHCQGEVASRRESCARQNPSSASYRANCNYDWAHSDSGGPDGMSCSDAVGYNWFERDLDSKRCLHGVMQLLPNTKPDAFACRALDKTALGVSTFSVGCGSAEAAERAKILALP